MKVIGVFLLTLGIMGLLLNLILWLPAKLNLIVMVVIFIVCVAIIWGGGKLSQSKTLVVREPATKYETKVQPSGAIQPRIVCPRCGWLGTTGQRFCGACGSSLVYCCPTCGAGITPASRFCSNCGAGLT